MRTEYVFLNEKGHDVGNLAFIDIGDKIINANGEWICEGLIAEVKTTIKVPSLVDKLRGISNTKEEELTHKYILKRINNGKE